MRGEGRDILDGRIEVFGVVGVNASWWWWWWWWSQLACGEI